MTPQGQLICPIDGIPYALMDQKVATWHLVINPGLSGLCDPHSRVLSNILRTYADVESDLTLHERNVNKKRR